MFAIEEPWRKQREWKHRGETKKLTTGICRRNGSRRTIRPRAISWLALFLVDLDTFSRAPLPLSHADCSPANFKGLRALELVLSSGKLAGFYLWFCLLLTLVGVVPSRGGGSETFCTFYLWWSFSPVSISGTNSGSNIRIVEPQQRQQRQSYPI